jgi:large subunit ribosomal protein L23
MGMNQERLMQVILAPLVSEKSTRIADKNHQVAFRVVPSATKVEIKAAVELMFEGIKVTSVSTLNVKGKQKRNGRRNNWKKAYVSLLEGQNIDLTAVAAE